MTRDEWLRANEVWADADLADTQDEAISIIATAIREAEDAALERASRELHMVFLMNLENADAGLIEQAADRLSALKHTKD